MWSEWPLEVNSKIITPFEACLQHFKNWRAKNSCHGHVKELATNGKYSSRFSEGRTTIIVELTIWEEELFMMLISVEPGRWDTVDADWNLSLAEGPLHPPLNTSVEATLTTLSVCRGGKQKWAHRRDKLRRSKSPAGINAPPSLT